MTVSAVRWAVVDTLHGRTGLPLPRLDFSRLGGNVTAYQLLIDIHYRHYQYYANMFVAMAIAFVCYRVNLGIAFKIGWPDVAFALLETVFLMTSRDTLRKYYMRSEQLLSTVRNRSPASPADDSVRPTVEESHDVSGLPVRTTQQTSADLSQVSGMPPTTERLHLDAV